MNIRNARQQRIVPLNCTPQPSSEVFSAVRRLCRYMSRRTTEARRWLERSGPHAYWM